MSTPDRRRVTRAEEIREDLAELAERRANDSAAGTDDKGQTPVPAASPPPLARTMLGLRPYMSTPDYDDGPPRAIPAGTWDPVVLRELYGRSAGTCAECGGPETEEDGVYEHLHDDCPASDFGRWVAKLRASHMPGRYGARYVREDASLACLRDHYDESALSDDGTRLRFACDGCTRVERRKGAERRARR